VNGDYNGRQHAGIDVHRRPSVIVRMTANGEWLAWARTNNDQGSRSGWRWPKARTTRSDRAS
jgi:hypothetical protein